MRLAWFVALIVAAVLPAGARAQSASAGPQAAYERDAVGVRRLVYPLRDGTMADEQGHARYDGRWDAFRGPDHHPIDEGAFYRIVGREDLLARYEHRSRIRIGVAVGSGVLLLGGSILATLTEMMERGAQGVVACASPGCGQLPPSQSISPVWGLTIAGTGLIGLVIAHYINPTPVDADEADRLARDYDESLRDRLGVTETAARD